MRELNIDWAALHSAFQMNMPEVRCFLSVEDGRVLKLPPGDPALATVRADPQRYVAVDAIPSRIQYQWLDEFIKSIEDGETKRRMEAAINGKGAFRRFKDILLTLPDERRRWFEYRDQMMRQRIIDWVREQGITPLNEAPWAGSQPTMLPIYDDLGPSMVTYNAAPVDILPPQIIKPTPAPALNSQHEVEALRDFLIEWSDNHNVAAMTSPLELEELALEIAKRFQVRSMHP